MDLSPPREQWTTGLGMLGWCLFTLRFCICICFCIFLYVYLFGFHDVFIMSQSPARKVRGEYKSGGKAIGEKKSGGNRAGVHDYNLPYIKHPRVAAQPPTMVSSSSSSSIFIIIIIIIIIIIPPHTHSGYVYMSIAVHRMHQIYISLVLRNQFFGQRWRISVWPQWAYK